MTSIGSTGDPSDRLHGDQIEPSNKEEEPCESTASDLEQQQPEAPPVMDEAGLLSEEGQNVLEKLGEIDLEDEDTEMLLEQAYAMNRQLKEILRQQERGESDESGTDSIRRVPRSDKHRGMNTRHSVLPPIKKSDASKQHDIYSARMSRPHQSTSSINSGKSKSATSRKTPSSSAHSGHTDSSRRSRSQKSASSSVGGDRPAWNDRFSYT
ncbi:uncharacterized protein LOC135473090 [Liolophura sinensis]|uniref:uncharacterized protein LOC135473090 n=1 Tax=Liolophura sinensis TaxID=3198878 RepID=UPI0031592C20